MSSKLQRMNPFSHYQLVKETWTNLEKNSHISFFNSWGWVSNWLKCLPENTNIEFIVNYHNEQAISCFFLGIKQSTEHKIFNKSRAYLNNTGYDEYDEIVVEYNSILCKEEATQQQFTQILLQLEDIEEFIFPISSNLPIEKNDAFFKRKISRLSYWVDLNRFTTPESYLSQLSKNKRTQIKRSFKEYGGQEHIKLQFASTTPEALDMLANLESLHQKEWLKKGKPGAFSLPFFKKFHHRLIQERFDAGEIQLIRIHTNDEDIGYLYNFTFNNEVLFYQSGFCYKESNHCRPGLVSHYLAITACMEKGFYKYNFLAGDNQYKQSLATHNEQLETIIITRKTIKARIEWLLRKILNK